VDEEFKVIKASLAGFESQRFARCQLLNELLRRRLPGGWGHKGTQVRTEPTALALLALHSASLPIKGGTALLTDAAGRERALVCRR
jgi:hypothetical protein